jgi:hypothetical protein
MTDSPIDTSLLTPQLQRVIRLAIIEVERSGSLQANRADVDSILVASIQSDDNVLAELLRACNLTIADIRNGNFTPRLLPSTPPAA